MPCIHKVREINFTEVISTQQISMKFCLGGLKISTVGRIMFKVVLV
jgi:hypothetical protein